MGLLDFLRRFFAVAAIKATYSKTWGGGGFAARNAIFK